MQHTSYGIIPQSFDQNPFRVLSGGAYRDISWLLRPYSTILVEKLRSSTGEHSLSPGPAETKTAQRSWHDTVIHPASRKKKAMRFSR